MHVIYMLHYLLPISTLRKSTEFPGERDSMKKTLPELAIEHLKKEIKTIQSQTNQNETYYQRITKAKILESKIKQIEVTFAEDLGIFENIQEGEYITNIYTISPSDHELLLNLVTKAKELGIKANKSIMLRAALNFFKLANEHEFAAFVEKTYQITKLRKSKKRKTQED